MALTRASNEPNNVLLTPYISLDGQIIPLGSSASILTKPNLTLSPSSGPIIFNISNAEVMRIDTNNSAIFSGSQIIETVTVSAGSANTTVIYDVMVNKNIMYYTSSAGANWTLNVRGNFSTPLNSVMSTGQSLTIVFLNTNGASAYYPTAFQIDGVAITPKWQGGTAPSSGNASSIDSYSYTIIKTANNTYTVLASQTRFA